ncbi:cigA protein [Rhodotorula toruloides]|uniref:CigA protein n=1 Tax=Rhodotorula toruloides TaxID=5286 RepID=A0A511K7I0_RHOTO|nr:cigA protein [Rhodotorula toruloides]
MPLPLHRTTPSRSRSNRPPSLTLSPNSIYNFDETDPFLSPTTPRSAPLSPRFLHPSSPRTPGSPYSQLGTPLSPRLCPNGHPQAGFFDNLPIPPTAKRARGKVWIVAGATACFLLLLAFSLHARTDGGSNEKPQGAMLAVHEELLQLKEWVGGSTGGQIGPASGEAADDDDEEGARTALGGSAFSTLEEEVVDEDGASEIRIKPLPRPRLPNLEDREERYLGFLPHSGYHNQRIALQNALLLGKLLNRTVLIPPIWIGWPTPTQYYADLRQSWLNIMLSTPSSFNISSLTPSSPLNDPASYSSTLTSFPCPTCVADNVTHLALVASAHERKLAKWRAQGYEVRPDGFPVVPGLGEKDCKSYSPECRFTYKDTFLAWDWLVDLEKAEREGVRMVDRWDMRERAVTDLLEVEEDDVYIVEDRQVYDFQFTDALNSSAPLISPDHSPSRWHRLVSLPRLAQLPQPVLLVGSLFGTHRIRTSNPSPSLDTAEQTFARAMSFKNPWLLRPADAIVERLGGMRRRDGYVGVHARVGDGEFARHARGNMERAWRELVEQLGVTEVVREEMWELVSKERAEREAAGRRNDGHRVKRAQHAVSSAAEASTWASMDEYDAELKRQASGARHVKRNIVDDLLSHVPYLDRQQPALALRNLTCRRPLHGDSRFAAFNTPLYLATDSRTPDSDPNLAPFFASFPCTFVLSDFDTPDDARNDGVAVASVKQMRRLVNDLDGVGLGRLLLPFLEAAVAARGRVTVGTEHSTFSGKSRFEPFERARSGC